jgi:hypothetical protein
MSKDLDARGISFEGGALISAAFSFGVSAAAAENCIPLKRRLSAEKNMKKGRPRQVGGVRFFT